MARRRRRSALAVMALVVMAPATLGCPREGEIAAPALPCDEPFEPCGGDIVGPVFAAATAACPGFTVGCQFAQAGVLELRNDGTVGAGGGFRTRVRLNVPKTCLQETAEVPGACDDLRGNVPAVDDVLASDSSLVCGDRGDHCLCTDTDLRAALFNDQARYRVSDGRLLFTGEEISDDQIRYCVVGDALALELVIPEDGGLIVTRFRLQRL